MANAAMFEGLVVDSEGRRLEVGWVGADACYIVDDAGFRRYVDASTVDQQVLRFLQEQVEAQKDVAVRGILQLLGKEDVFSKTAVEYSIKHMDETLGQPLPPQARDVLGMMGFRIEIDERGDLLAIRMPEMDAEDE